MRIAVGVPRAELMSLQDALSEEVATRPNWTGIVDLWCSGESVNLAAVVGSRVVGAAAICYFGDGFCEIHKLYVAPGWRRRDVATQLVGEAERMARDRGWLEIGVQISGDGVSFWERYLGSRMVDVEPEGKVVFRVDR